MQHERTQQLDNWLSLAEPELSDQASYVRTRLSHCRAKTYPAFLKWALATIQRQSELTRQFEDLYQHHRGIVTKALWRVLRGVQRSDPETLYDIEPRKRLQNSAITELESRVWQRVWELLPDFDPERAKITTWLFAVATGEARNHRAKRLRRSQYQALLPNLENHGTDAADPLELMALGKRSVDGYVLTDWSAIEELKFSNAQIAGLET